MNTPLHVSRRKAVRYSSNKYTVPVSDTIVCGSPGSNTQPRLSRTNTIRYGLKENHCRITCRTHPHAVVRVRTRHLMCHVQTPFVTALTNTSIWCTCMHAAVRVRTHHIICHVQTQIVFNSNKPSYTLVRLPQTWHLVCQTEHLLLRF